MTAKRRNTPEESSEQENYIYDNNIFCECWEIIWKQHKHLSEFSVEMQRMVARVL
jgi:hypothetical protein